MTTANVVQASLRDLRREQARILKNLTAGVYNRVDVADGIVIVTSGVTNYLLPLAIGFLAATMPKAKDLSALTGTEWFWIFILVGLLQLVLGTCTLLWGTRIRKSARKLASTQSIARLFEQYDQTVDGLAEGALREAEYKDELYNHQIEELRQRCFRGDAMQTLVGQQSVAILAGLSVLRAIMHEIAPISDLGKADKVGQLLTPLLEELEDVLLFTDKDNYWNVVVYVYYENDGELRKLFRDCDKRIKPKNRILKPGQGSIGSCFANGRATITPDLAADPTLILDQKRDLEYYRSIASFPIFGAEAKGQSPLSNPIGVLEFTGSKAGHFRVDNCENIGETYAVMLALLLGHLRIS